MLMARKRLILGVALATLILTFIAVMALPRMWTATSDVFIDFKENDPIAGRSFSANLDESYLQTQIDMIRSQAVAEHMIRTLGLLKPDEGVGTAAHTELIAGIARNLEVTNQRSSRVLTVSFTADSPTKAATYANAIVKSYIAVSQNISSSVASNRTEQYNAQLDQLRNEVSGVQDKLTRYQQESGIVDSLQTGDIELRRLNDMSTALLALDTQRDEARARNETIDKLLKAGMRPEDLPQTGLVTPINDARESLTIVNRQLGELRGAMGPNHPTVRGLLAERQQLLASIARQSTAAVDVQRTDLDRIQAQRDALTQDIEKQRAKVLDQMVKRDRVAAYQRQLAGVEQVYNSAIQKYDSILMASSISLPNLAVLRPAEAPNRPSYPKVRSSLVLGLLVGLVGGLALAMLLELRRRRVRSVEDVVKNTTLPLIGRIGRPAPAFTSATL